MKLCVFTENYLKGGLDTFTVNLLNNMPLDADITFMCNENHANLNFLKTELETKIKIVEYSFFTNSVIAWRYRNQRNRITVRVVQFLEYFLRYTILIPIYLLRLSLIFKRDQFDSLLVINGGYPGGIISRLACISFRLKNINSRCILNIHNDAVKIKPVAIIQEYFLDKLIRKSVDLLIFPSESTKRAMLNRPVLFSMPQTVVYNGINNQRAKSVLSTTRSNKTIVMAGTLEERKGHIFALEALSMLVKEMQDVKLYFFGEGTAVEENRIISKIKELSLQKNVFLMGFDENILESIASATVLVMPSQEFESFGLVLIEAMSVGTPVICTNVGGMPEVVQQGQAGIIVDKKHPKQMARALRKIFLDNKYARSLGENGMKLQRDKFNAKSMAKKYYEILTGE